MNIATLPTMSTVGEQRYGSLIDRTSFAAGFAATFLVSQLQKKRREGRSGYEARDVNVSTVEKVRCLYNE